MSDAMDIDHEPVVSSSERSQKPKILSQYASLNPKLAKAQLNNYHRNITPSSASHQPRAQEERENSNEKRESTSSTATGRSSANEPPKSTIDLGVYDGGLGRSFFLA
jgi:hypothetical protein